MPDALWVVLGLVAIEHALVAFGLWLWLGRHPARPRPRPAPETPVPAPSTAPPPLPPDSPELTREVELRLKQQVPGFDRMSESSRAQLSERVIREARKRLQ